MIFQVTRGDSIIEYYVLGIDKEKLENLKEQILERYSKVMHCEYIDSTVPTESSKVKNINASVYSEGGEETLYKIEADFISYPNDVIDAINGTLIGSGKGLTDLMSLNAIDNPIMGNTFLDELRGISTQHSEGGSDLATVQEVITLSKKVIATDLETEALYSELKSCVRAITHSVRSVPSRTI